MKNFIQRYKNAKKAIEQIKKGEWIPVKNNIGGEHLTAKRGNFFLWIGNGPFFCDIMSIGLSDLRYFGLFFRHYVWWAAARKMKTTAEKKYYSSRDNRTPIL